MANANHKPSDEDIHKVYEMLGIATEEQRRQILSRLSFPRQKKEISVRLQADSVTTPYTDNNA
jgi:hypothetical protein